MNKNSFKIQGPKVPAPEICNIKEHKELIHVIRCLKEFLHNNEVEMDFKRQLELETLSVNELSLAYQESMQELNQIKLDKAAMQKRIAKLEQGLKTAYDFKCGNDDCRRWSNKVCDDFCHFHKAVFKALSGV